MLGKVLGALHVQSHAQQTFDFIKRTQAALHKGQGAHGADFRRQLRLGETGIGASAAGDYNRVTDSRNLAADIQFVLVANDRDVIAADLDFSVEAVTQLLGCLSETGVC